MKRFIGFFILLIGMISLTGFSSTTDLTKDSITVLVDTDVGIADAVLVETNINFSKNSERFSNDYLFARHQDNKMFINTKISLENYNYIQFPLPDNIPIINFKKLINDPNKSIYRSPRDAL